MNARRTLLYSCLILLAALGVVAALVDKQPGSAKAAYRMQDPSPAIVNPQVDGAEPLPPGASIQTILPNMAQPIAMAFDPQGRLFYTEKETGNVRLYSNGTLQPSPVIHFDADPSAEGGLLGIAVDPNFNTNHYIYVFYRCGTPACLPDEDWVVRFVENNGAGSNPTTIFTGPQTGSYHISGNIHFGPDGKLYIAMGENGNPNNAQDVTVPNGKFHRINSDGTIPSDNPVFTQTGALRSLYAMGLRNSFDFTFDPLTPGRIFASENGPGCDDEMNRIVGGYNYGWGRPGYDCDDAHPSPQYNTIPPLWYLGVGECCEAPTGITVYSGSQIPQWQNGLFMATYNTQALRHFYLNTDRTQVTATNIVQGVSVGTDIETGPDGALWYIEGSGYMSGTLKRIVGPGAPTPTRTPTGAAFLIGHVTWQGRPAQPNAAQSLPITLTLRAGSGPYHDYATTTDTYGFFTVTLGGLSTGNYAWRVKSPQYLAASGSVALAGGINRAELGLQLAGDASNDNCVTVTDFNILRNTFGRSLGDPGYDPRADFTGDNTIAVGDFNLLKLNMGTCGAMPIRPQYPYGS